MAETLTLRQRRLLQLNCSLPPRPSLWLAALERFGPEDVLKIPPAAAGGEPEAAERVLRLARRLDVEAELSRADLAGARPLFIGEPGYPELLAAAEDAPLVLYVRGRLDVFLPAIAVVGSRFPTAYGRRMAARLAGDAAAAGYCVASGLARGIDAEAHQAALRVEGATWAVLGCGVDRAYPAENAKLAQDIVASGGAVVSEHPMGDEPLKGHFPRRNRIVSGLSWATVVVEGRMKSGSLITARCALEQGRCVLAVPGPADSPLSEAPHHLLARGARLAAGFGDVLDELPPGARPPARGLALDIRKEEPHGLVGAAALSLEHRKILECLGSDSLTIEELGRSTGLDFPRLSTIIFELEIQNLVGSLPGQRYAKKRN